jgi:C4-dicarboxylate-specific signal transduction histidine kinase
VSLSSKDGNKSLDLEADDLQRFAELGRLSASLLHEISNPLTAAMLYLDQMVDQKSYSTRSLRRNLLRLTKYVNAARGQLKDKSSDTSFYIDAQLRDVKRLTLPLARSSYVKLTISKVPHIRLKGDPLQFQQIMVNLIVNAIEAYPNATIASDNRYVAVEMLAQRNYLNIKIKDKGMGISSDCLSMLFRPFYTTKGGHGLGLGLVIVKRYVEDDFDGIISVTSSTVYGTCFSVKLPV